MANFREEPVTGKDNGLLKEHQVLHKVTRSNYIFAIKIFLKISHGKTACMKNIIISLSIIFMVTSSSNYKKEEADLVIINGKVLTIDKDNPVSEAIAVKGEKIIAIGTSSQISRMISKGITEGY